MPDRKKRRIPCWQDNACLVIETRAFEIEKVLAVTDSLIVVMTLVEEYRTLCSMHEYLTYLPAQSPVLSCKVQD